MYILIEKCDEILMKNMNGYNNIDLFAIYMASNNQCNLHLLTNCSKLKLKPLRLNTFPVYVGQLTKLKDSYSK